MPMPARGSAAPAGGSRFQTRTEVDFVVIGSGAAAGVLAKELSTAGFSVVVLEQGPYLRPSQFRHDELGGFFNFDLLPKPSDFPTTFRKTEKDEATVQAFPPSVLYAKLVGGSSVHFTANYWRFRPIDFVERSRIGPIEGTGFADWPITYPQLDPYYPQVGWLGEGAPKRGLHAVPAPMAVLSRPHNNRASCIHCGFCMFFGCEVGAKSSSLGSMLPLAEGTGRCEIRPESTVFRIEINAAGRVTQVLYWDRDGSEQAQRAKAVVVSANGAETSRLL